MFYPWTNGWGFPRCILKCWWRPSHWWYGIKDFCQRGWRGYSSLDQWSFDTYLADILIRALPKYQHRNGTVLGYMLGEDRDRQMDINVRMTDDEERAAFDRWDKMIDEIVIGMQLIVDDDYVGDDAQWAKIERGWALFAEHVHRFWI